MPRRSLLVFTITAAVLAAAAWAGPEPAPEPLPGDALARVEPAVVIVETFDADGGFLGAVAAFFAEPDWLITNLHCVEGVSEAVVNLGERGVLRVDGVIAESERLDIVVMRAQVPPGVLTPLKLGDRPAARRTPVAVVVRDGEGNVAVSPGRVVREILQGDPGAVITTSPGWGGCSGAPLVGHDGTVVGVVNSLYSETMKVEAAAASAAPAHLVRALEVGPVVPLREWWASREVPGGPQCREWRGYGDAYDMDEEYAEAADAYVHALEHVPTDIRSAIGYSRAIEAQGRATDAALWLTKFLRETSESAEGWKSLGDIYLRAGQCGGAVIAYRRSAELEPSADTHFWLGMSYSGAGAFRDARDALARALEMDPEHESALEYFEDLCLYEGMHEEACDTHLRRLALLGTVTAETVEVAKTLVAAGQVELAARIEAAASGHNRHIANRIASMIKAKSGGAKPNGVLPSKVELPVTQGP